MRSVAAALREALVGGDGTFELDLILEDDALALTASRLSLNLSGLKSDDFWDAGGVGSLWGEAAASSQGVACLFNPAAAGQTSAWYLHRAGGGAAVSGGETGGQYCRPGLCANGANFWGFYITTNGTLKVSALTWSPDGNPAWSGSPVTIASLGTLSGAACAAIDGNTVQVAGYQGRCLWLQRFTYSGSWTAGAKQVVAYVANGRLLPQSVSAAGSVVTLHLGGGLSASFIYANGLYSAPYPLLGTPPDQRTYSWGMSYYNSRYWLVVTTDLHGENGQYFAPHTRLLSSPSGLHWRDEGPIVPTTPGGNHAPLLLRGKFLVPGDTCALITPTCYLTGDTPYWAGTPKASRTQTVTPIVLQGKHPGVRGTMELHASTAASVTLTGGARVRALLKQGTDETTLFTGYLDVATAAATPGKLQRELTARGPLGRMIGETAYRPPAVIDLPGRAAWCTNFRDTATGTPVNGVATNEGNWIAQAALGKYELYTPDGGNVFIPQPFSGMNGYFRVRFKASGPYFGFAFGNSDETDKLGMTTGSAWLAGFDNTTLRIVHWDKGVVTPKASAAATGYTAGVEAELVLQLTPGKITLTLIPSPHAAAASWVTLSYDLLAGAETTDWPDQWTLSLYETRLLNTDGSYASRPCYLYEVTACGADAAWTTGEIITRCAELAGVTLTTTETTYSGIATGGVTYPRVSLVNCLVEIEASGDQFYLKGQKNASGTPTGTLLTFRTGYVTVDGVDYPYTLPAFTTGWVRVVWYDNQLSLYSGDLLLCSLFCRPRHPSGYLWATRDFKVQDLYWPAEAAAWDYNQPADGILQRLLDRRRVYLFETVDGTAKIVTSPEGTDLISAAAPVGTHTYYRRAVTLEERGVEARATTGIVGIIGVDSTVYLIDQHAPRYGSASMTIDNPWALSVDDALTEAKKVVEDNWRARNIQTIGGFFDPALEILDYFALSDATVWVAQGYEWQWALDDSMEHSARVFAVQKSPAAAGAVWGTAIWGQFDWS